MAPPERPRPALLLVLAALGALLVARYLAVDAGLPRGAEEFDYHLGGLAPVIGSAMRGFTHEQLASHLGRLALLGPALLLLVAPVERVLRGAWPDHTARRRLVRVASVLSLVLLAWLMFGLFQGRAIIEDELTYRLQAMLLVDGRLGDPAGASWPYPGKPFTIWTAHGTTGKYLFGEPVVQIPGTLAGYPALLHLPLAGLTLWAVHRTLRGAADDAVADWTTLLLAASPMFLFTSAIGLSNATSLYLLAFAALGLQLAREGARGTRGTLDAAVLVGVSLGFGLAVRVQSVAPGGVFLGFATLYTLLKARRWGSAAALVGTGSVFVAAILAYSSALTGSPTKLPWMLYTPVERYGFGPVWEGIDLFTHTPWTALENLAVTLGRFNGWWLGWPASLGLLVAWAALGRPRAGAGPYLAIGAGIVLFHVGYYSPGVSDTGPVYYIELLLPACVLGAHAVVAAGARWPGFTGAALAVHLLLGTGTFFGEQVARLERLVAFIHASSDDALSRIEPPALLLVETRGGELRNRGWIWSGFPRWDRGARDPVVVYPRQSAENAAALRARFPDRACWYYRTHPRTGGGELGRCEGVTALLERDP